MASHFTLRDPWRDTQGFAGYPLDCSLPVAIEMTADQDSVGAAISLRTEGGLVIDDVVLDPQRNMSLPHVISSGSDAVNGAVFIYPELRSGTTTYGTVRVRQTTGAATSRLVRDRAGQGVTDDKVDIFAFGGLDVLTDVQPLTLQRSRGMSCPRTAEQQTGDAVTIIDDAVIQETIGSRTATVNPRITTHSDEIPTSWRVMFVVSMLVLLVLVWSITRWVSGKKCFHK